jgi:hypothetical protein
VISKIAMTHLRRSPAYILIILALTAVFIGLGNATTTQFTVKAEGEVTHPINLIAEDRVLIQFKVIGTTSSLIQFSLIFPNATSKEFGESGDFSYSFVCDAEGEYTLNFTNNDPTESKLVTLNYEIDHYIFGMPQMLFMVILIAVVSMVGVAVFIGLSRKP